MPDDRLYENLRLWQPSAASCERPFSMPKLAPEEWGGVKRWRQIGELRGRDLIRG